MVDYKVSIYNGEHTFDYLIDYVEQVKKAVPDMVFKPAEPHTWNMDKTLYPKGIIHSFKVHHISDLNNHIGTIGVSEYHSEKPKYGITCINIEDGRNSYGIDGQQKYSIHAKNMVRVAKKVLKPFTFDQIAERCSRAFHGNIDSLSNNMKWELRQKTCDGYQHLINDFENLYHTGYTPKNAKFKQMMEYVMENKEKIDKYMDYNPEHYFVLVKDNEVQYRLNHLKGDTPYKVPSKDALPDDIKGKLFVLDITDNLSFVEDVGLKENDGAYWIIA
jgi:hypothetical protein